MKTLNGYAKERFTNDYMLLAGYGTKSISDFLLKSGGTMTGALTVPSISVTGAATFSLAINGSILGNSATASRLQNARTISLSGSVTGSGTFDGSGNITISTSVNHSHSYVNTIGKSGSTITWSINGTAQTALNFSTTFAPYNANGYLALNGGTMTGALTVPSLTVTGIFKPTTIELLNIYESSGTNGGSGADIGGYITTGSTSGTVNGFRIGYGYEAGYSSLKASMIMNNAASAYPVTWNYFKSLFDRLMLLSSSPIALTYQVKLGGRRIIDVYRINGTIINLWLINDPNEPDATKNIIINRFGTIYSITLSNFSTYSFNGANLLWSTWGTNPSEKLFKAYTMLFSSTTPYLLRIIEGTNNVYIMAIKLN